MTMLSVWITIHARFNIKNRLYGLKLKNTPKFLSSGGVDVVAANCKILSVTRFKTVRQFNGNMVLSNQIKQ